MSFLKHPAHADAHAGLWAFARFDAGAGNDGGNTDEDPDTFSQGFTDTFGADLNATLAPHTSQMAISAVTPSLIGLAIGAMSGVRSAAEAAGISTADPTTNNVEGGQERDLWQIVQENEGVQVGLENDYTKRIDNPENLALRRRLVEIYNRALDHSGGSSLFDWNEAGGYADTRFMEDFFGSQPSGLGDDDWSWHQPNNVWRFLRQKLNDETFAPYAVVDRDFGELEGFNRYLAQTYRDFLGDFGSGEFGDYAASQGIWDEVNAARDDWFGNNDDLNMALAREYGFQDRFDGQGSFWNFVDQEGIDRSQVQNFIDRFNGTGDYADPFDGTDGSVGGDDVIVDTTDILGGGDASFGDDIGQMFTDFADALTGTLSAYQTDLSSIFSDLPDYSLGPEVVRGASKDEADRAGVNQLRIDLDDDLLRRSRAGRSGLIPFTGLQF